MTRSVRVSTPLPTEQRTLNAFISLSHQDLDLVTNELMPAFHRAGVSPWIYQSIIPGDNWIESVLKQITDGDWLVVVLTERYQQSIRERRGACYAELLWMMDQVTTSRRRTRLIVILQHGEVPDLLRNWNAIDLRTDRSQLVRRLESAANEDRRAATCVGDAAAALEATPPPRLDRPVVSGPGDMPELVRYNFDFNADRYLSSILGGRSMQRDNAEALVRLFAAFMRDGRARKPEVWLDAGCGTGLVAFVLNMLHNRRGRDFAWVADVRARLGFDYAPQMIRLLHKLNGNEQHLYSGLFEGDLRHCDVDMLRAQTGENKVDLIIANNVFHWLYTEEAITRSFRRAYEMLDRNGGCLAASIAAEGTGSEFLTAYRAEIEARLDGPRRDAWQRHLQNPIGLQRLDMIVDIARRCRFRIERAQLAYEPKEFDSTDEYVADARAYGEDVFMAPLLGLSADERETVWGEISRRFRELHLAKFNQSVYIHDQYMVYLIAVRHD
jgi:SAM-dependent methyltransferase